MRFAVVVAEVVGVDEDFVEDERRIGGAAEGNHFRDAGVVNSRLREAEVDNLLEGEQAGGFKLAPFEDGEVGEGDFHLIVAVEGIGLLVEFGVEGAAPVEVSVAEHVGAESSHLCMVEVNPLAVGLAEQPER